MRRGQRISSPRISLAGSRPGAAAVEFALTLPLMIMMLSGLWEAGCILRTQQAIYNSAREAARQAATGTYTTAQVQQIALSHLKINLRDTTGAMTANATATAIDLNSPSIDVSQAASLDQLQVTITVPFKDVRWIKMPLVSSDSSMLVGKVTWVSMIDIPFPTTLPQPPQG